MASPTSLADPPFLSSCGPFPAPPYQVAYKEAAGMALGVEAFKKSGMPLLVARREYLTDEQMARRVAHQRAAAAAQQQQQD